MPTSGRVLAVVAIVALLPACSIRKTAVNKLGDALAETGSGFASDEDPELIGDAIPFGLKTMESLLAESPRHEGLLLAACSGFVQYAYGWIQLEADYVEEDSLSRATHMRERARKMYLRALEYGLRGLEVDHTGIRERLRTDPGAALEKTRKPRTCPSSTGRRRPGPGPWPSRSTTPRCPRTSPSSTRWPAAPSPSTRPGRWARSTSSSIGWESGRSSIGGSKERALEHYEEALRLSRGLKASPHVTYAESISVAEQDRAAFTSALEKALAVDATEPNDQRLVNILMHQRATWLLERADEYFIE